MTGMRAWFSSLRVRLTSWYAALLAVPLVAFAILCYVVFSSALLSRSDRFIGDALSAFSRELLAERRAASTPEQAIRATISEVFFPDLRIVILDSARRVIASSAAEAGEPPDRQPSAAVEAGILAAVQTLPTATGTLVTIGTGRDSYRLSAQPIDMRGRTLTIAAAYPLRDIEDVLARIRRLLIIAIPLLVLLAAVGGYALASRSLAPIEASITQQRRFMADASHELRTPTTILRTEADVTLSRAHRDESEYRASFTVIRDAARRLTRIVEDLFLLARADSGHLVPRLEPVHIDDLVHDAVQSVRHVAELRAVQVRLESVEEVSFSGDADLLGRLLLNLLDNAIRHSPEKGVVQVQMTRNNGRLEIAVVDSGPGIPAEAQARVFERFFRADPARSRNETTTQSGAGLGLAIGRRIAELHGGQLELVQSRPGLTEFRLALPI